MNPHHWAFYRLNETSNAVGKSPTYADVSQSIPSVQARDSQDTSSALRAHALADISSPAGSMPEGTTQSALQAHAPSAHDHQHSSEASGLEDSSPEASVAGRSSSGRKKFDSEDLSGATSFASAAHDTPDAEGDMADPYNCPWCCSTASLR